jgi:hypothetical protein
MTKINGIKTIDLEIKACGHGVVNWNGSMKLQGDDGKEISNHTLPKLRGYSNLSGRLKDNSSEDKMDYAYKKTPYDIDFKKTPLYISQNCIRHHLFKHQSYDAHFANDKGVDDTKLLFSDSGMIRGYVLPASLSFSVKRESCLLLEDFVDQLGNGNFEQMGQSGARDSSSFFSKTTFGDTKYISYGSINVEKLQFISLDKKYDRPALRNFNNTNNIINGILDYLNNTAVELNLHNLNPSADFGGYCRIGSIYNEPENGILLNNDAIHILVNKTLSLINNLYIHQAKSWMAVDSVLTDYNDSNKGMRIKRDKISINENNSQNLSYATFYEKTV